MKIRRLTIHNIASIEDATLDFAQAPLANTDIFLITGTTGAGKTTILDAICLALFNTTPRLNDLKSRIVAANKDGLAANDPRNIMRLNTGEASVVLTFEGTDGNSYEAEWHVQRGRLKKSSTGMSNAVWSIRNLSTGEETSGNKQGTYEDVRQAAIQAVGMDFDQFCRTTMLAQGQFTRFLSCEESEKAEILEKITNTEIFSRLGQQLYAILQEKDKAYKDEQDRIGQIQLLTEEQVAEIRTEIQALSQAIDQSDTAGKDIESRIAWFKTQAEDAAAVQKAQKEYEALAAEIHSDAFLHTKQRLQDRQATTEVRGHLTASDQAEQEAAKQRQAIRELQAVYVRCSNGKAWAEQQQAQTEAQIGAIQRAIDAHASCQALYEQAQTIAAELQRLDQLTREQADLQTTLANEQQTYARYTALAEKAKQDAADKTYAAEALQKTTDKARQSLPDTDALYQKKSAIESIVYLKKEAADRNRQKSESEKLLASYVQQRNEQETLLRKATDELREQKDALEKRKDSVDKWAKNVRAKLTVGCQCPVCLQTLQAPLPDTAELDSEYNALSKKLEQQQATTDNLRDALNKACAHHSSEQARLKETEAGLRNLHAELQKQLQAYTWADPQSVASAPPATLQDTILAETTDAIRRANEQKNALAQQERTLRQLQKDKEDAVLHYNRQIQAAAESKAQIEKTKQALQKNRQTQADLIQTLEGYHLERLHYDTDIQSNAPAFAVRLTQAALQYNQRVQEKAELQKAYHLYHTRLDALPPLPAGLPAEWTSTPAVPVRNDRLTDDWNLLQTDFATAHSRLTEATEQYTIHQTYIAQYLAEHPKFPQTYLRELNSYSQQAYEEATQAILTKEEQYKNAQKNRQNAIALQQLHLQSKPPTAQDTDTLPDLERQKADNQKMRDEQMSRRTLLDKQLADNEENRKRKQDTTRLEQLRMECVKWNVFKDIADKEGKNFRNVAQSMILRSLLDTANTHLHRLEPRYTLRIIDNSLNLKLEDAYQGFSTRSTNTISGGESFLVSLALALALADFGQNMGVNTLFIDEGFGTLSGTPLNNAINLLKSLHHQNGTQVGIISHREEIKEKIDVQIQVLPVGNAAASKVEVSSMYENKN